MAGTEDHVADRGSVWLFLITFTLVFYGMGASYVESFVNYPTWRHIGAAEFQAYHQALGPLIIGFMVVPVFLAIPLTALLIWKRPFPIPSWALWVALLMQIICAVSSATIQIPIQVQLTNNGLSLPLIDQLISTNFWYRRIPMFINSVLFFWMMARLLMNRTAPRSMPEKS